MSRSRVKTMNNFSNLTKNINKIICIVVGLLTVLSILMIGSKTVSTNFFSKSVIVQTAAFVLGVVAIIIMLKYNYTMFRGREKFLYIFSVVCLLLVYIPGLGVERYGARSWINLGIIDFQPSELVKILFILILAGYFETHQDELYNFRGLLRSAIVAAPLILIVLKEDLGSALVFATIWLLMLIVAGIDGKTFLKFLGIVVAIMPVTYIFMANHQKDRIEAFLHPDNLALPANYQVWQSRIAIGSGGFFGKGLFKGTQKELDFIPVQTSDFIFSIIGEELGFLGGLAVIAMYGILLVEMMRVASRSKDLYGSLIVAGVVGMFLFQIFENIAMTMGMMPVTGVTLPFLSYGGSSEVANMLALGLVLNVDMRNAKLNF